MAREWPESEERGDRVAHSGRAERTERAHPADRRGALTGDSLEREWLEADGLGGFASGTVSLVRTRRYHALLLVATTPPTGRVVLVAGFDARVEWNEQVQPIVTQVYAGGVRAPEDAAPIARFESDPWPCWHFRLRDGSTLVQELVAVHGSPRVVVAWTLVDAAGEPMAGRLIVRPYLAARDYHALQRGPGRGAGSDEAAGAGSASDGSPHEGTGDALLAAPRRRGDAYEFATSSSLPPLRMRASGRYVHAPHWYRDFLLAEEERRGFAAHEDLASPGELVIELTKGRGGWIVEAIDRSEDRDEADREVDPGLSAEARTLRAVEALLERERARRLRLGTALDRAASAYLVRRGAGQTIVAGYPWFTDWGRDTFIALRGLCLARGELETARAILLEWADAIDAGQLPNRFADRGEAPEYNAVDASLWYVVCVEELLRAEERAGLPLDASDRERLARAVDAILSGHARGTRHGIRLDRDGLLAAGEPGVQLTWMDARVGDHVVTPRIGKPVEVQALWWNALRCGSRFDARWAVVADRARASFERRFWNPARGLLHDVVDVDHVAGAVDPSFRPNQLFAVGGLPWALVEGERAARLVEACEAALWTPSGLRSLAPEEPGYVPRYAGGPVERDLAYHQGTVWPWLAGSFVESWVRVRGGGLEAKRAARRRFLEPLFAGLDVAGLGHLPEITDAEAPHAPRGCPFQAWSLAELIRLDRVVLAED
ncbi:MAG: amylo-alpha-1,6-glucosidase [Myxococcota bacterium]